VVLLKCTLAEARKHEQERVDAALRDQRRKIARREGRQPNLLQRFLQTKCARALGGERGCCHGWDATTRGCVRNTRVWCEP
jgi:hypothetical protein